MAQKIGRHSDPLFRVGGVAGMARSLRKLGDEELSKEMRAASLEAAEKIVPFAKKMVPVRTGQLRDSIKAGATRRYGRIIAGTPTRTKYARAVHRGHYTPSGSLTRATKYISKAVPKAFPEIISEYRKAMTRISKKFEAKHGVSRVYGGYR
tara:strand:- start:537 stop:989 length:453 start_codon:yes stop_codon:yes gene_type:complete